MRLHAQRQRLGAAQDEIRIPRTWHRPDRILVERDLLADFAVVGDRHSADDVAMSADILRRRVHDDVGAEMQRLLQIRRRKRVVATISTPGGLPAAIAAISQSLSVGLLGVSSHSIRVLGLAAFHTAAASVVSTNVTSMP